MNDTIRRKAIVHQLKCWEEYFQAVKTGVKPFEIRLNDRDYHVGDTLVLREYLPLSDLYSGDELIRTISYITNWEQQDGYVVLGIPSTESEGEAGLSEIRVTDISSLQEDKPDETSPVKSHQVIWSENINDPKSPNIFVTPGGRIGISINGFVAVYTIHKWHKFAFPELNVDWTLGVDLNAK